jgi:tryptophanyl-tRNA synthetase
MYTDPNRVHPTDPGRVEGNPVFSYLDLFSEKKDEIKELKKRYRAGKVGDVEVKRFLLEELDKFLDPIRRRRKEFENDKKKIDKIIKDGTEKGKQVASETLYEVKKSMGINYLF